MAALTPPMHGEQCSSPTDPTERTRPRLPTRQS